MAFRVAREEWVAPLFQPQRKAFFNFNALFVAQRNVTSGLINTGDDLSASSGRKRRHMNAGHDLRHGGGVHRKSSPARVVIVVVPHTAERPESPASLCRTACRRRTPSQRLSSQQLHTGVARELRRALTRGDAMALRVDREDGDLQTIDQVAQTILPVAVGRVEPRQFLNIEQSTLERALRTRRRRDERIHFTDQHVDVCGCARTITPPAARARRGGRVQRRREHHDRNVLVVGPADSRTRISSASGVSIGHHHHIRQQSCVKATACRWSAAAYTA